MATRASQPRLDQAWFLRNLGPRRPTRSYLHLFRQAPGVQQVWLVLAIHLFRAPIKRQRKVTGLDSKLRQPPHSNVRITTYVSLCRHQRLLHWMSLWNTASAKRTVILETAVSILQLVAVQFHSRRRPLFVDGAVHHGRKMQTVW